MKHPVYKNVSSLLVCTQNNGSYINIIYYSDSKS